MNIILHIILLKNLIQQKSKSFHPTLVKKSKKPSSLCFLNLTETVQEKHFSLSQRCDSIEKTPSRPDAYMYGVSTPQ